MSPAAGDPGVGSASEEAARLADALKGLFWGAATELDAAAEDSAHDPLTCRVCPLCRGIAAVRSVRPEVVDHLASAAESLAAALRALGAARTPSPRQAQRADQAGPTYETVSIDVDDADEDEGAA